MSSMLPSSDLKASAPRIIVFPVLNSPAHPYRYRRFACPLAGADARLAGKRGLVTPSFQGTCTPCLLPVRLAHQIRTCALTHTAPTFGSDRAPRGHAVSVRPPVSRFLGSVSDPCFGLADSRRSPALAPATPQRLDYRLVRCLHRYYAGVRLLRALHHRLTASRLPDAVLPVAR